MFDSRCRDFVEKETPAQKQKLLLYFVEEALSRSMADEKKKKRSLMASVSGGALVCLWACCWAGLDLEHLQVAEQTALKDAYQQS